MKNILVMAIGSYLFSRLVARRQALPTNDQILEAYGIYDSDPRVNDIDDYEAFRDAVLTLFRDGAA